MKYILLFLESICLLSFIIYTPELFQISFPLVIFIPKIVIQEILDEIPKEYIKKYVRIDLRLPPYSYDHIKLVEESRFYDAWFYYKGVVNNINRECCDFNASYVCLKNMYCCNTASFCTENLSYIEIDHSLFKWIRNPLNGTVIESYENVIALGHSQIFQFGHFFSDILIPLLMFPNDIISKSYLVLNNNARIHVDYFKFINFPSEKAIFLKPKKWIFASNLYTPVDPIVHIAHYGKLSNMFSFKLRKYFNLTDIIPSLYFVTNRKKNYPRYISNMEDVLNILKHVYPERNFQVLQDINNFNEAAKLWGSAKLVLGPTGSNLFKHYVMANKTILVIIASNSCDTALAMGAASHDVFSLFSRLPGMHHLFRQMNIFNITEAIRVVKIALWCVDHGYFNPNERYKF